jgi:hypothetical protein
MAELKVMRDLIRAKYGGMKVLESQLLGEYLARGFAETHRAIWGFHAEQKQRSWVNENEAGYPYPELSTVVLMAVGLLALIGYVGYRKKKLPKN